MIDPHVHLRDWKQDHKETVKHGLEVAYSAGLDAIFEMPNTSPSLISKETIGHRVSLADEARIPIFHGLYAGILPDEKQIEEMVEAYHDLFPRVVGFKAFFGQSTGNLGIIEEEDQKFVWETLAGLGYEGVLAGHFEEQSLFKPELWDPLQSYTHTLARPPEAEVKSLEKQIEYAQQAGYQGTLHICHISAPESLKLIGQEKTEVDFDITCGLTPHHALLHAGMMKAASGLLLKMNPPLRTQKMQEYMLKSLLDGKIDWIETDHAPHIIDEKIGRVKDEEENPIYSSGVPGLPFYPHFMKTLKEEYNLPQKQIDDLTHHNIIETFNLSSDLIPLTHKEPDYKLANEYEFDPFEGIK